MGTGDGAIAVEIERLRGALERARKLASASHALHTTLDLVELLDLILNAALDGVQAELGTVFVLDPEKNELWSQVLVGVEGLEIRVPVGKGVAGNVAASGQTIRLEDAYDDERFDRSWDKKTGLRTRGLLAVPIRNRKGATVGVFQLLNKKEGNFEQEDEDYLDALSIHAALALENARLHKSAIEQERQEREIRLAQTVQRQLQPERRVQVFQSLTVAGFNELCEDATGDYYDILRTPETKRLGVTVGDASGHGLQAAFVMAVTRSLLRAFARTVSCLKEGYDLLNDFLVPDLVGGRFITLVSAIIDSETGEVEWCNAGHNPPFHYSAATGEIRPLEATGRVLGILEDADYGAGEPFTLEPGDALLLYTDGVTEARAGSGEELFGEERLQAAFRDLAGEHPEEIIDGIRLRVHEFTDHAPNEDDVTMLAVKRKRNKSSD